jgi:hypothetical protein
MYVVVDNRVFCSSLRYSNRKRIDVEVCWHAVTYTFYQVLDVLKLFEWLESWCGEVNSWGQGTR